MQGIYPPFQMPPFPPMPLLACHEQLVAPRFDQQQNVITCAQLIGPAPAYPHFNIPPPGPQVFNVPPPPPPPSFAPNIVPPTPVAPAIDPRNQQQDRVKLSIRVHQIPGDQPYVVKSVAIRCQNDP
uniref:Uncharacterized protein n=1 Tax=Panagrolaimus sp. ES5 TaxID=591445 RepID=A0AC34GTE2_9BILA